MSPSCAERKELELLPSRVLGIWQSQPLEEIFQGVVVYVHRHPLWPQRRPALKPQGDLFVAEDLSLHRGVIEVEVSLHRDALEVPPALVQGHPEFLGG